MIFNVVPVVVFVVVCSIQLAYAVDYNSYGLIFGFNTFLSLILMTILTFAVADEHGFNLDIQTQVSSLYTMHLLYNIGELTIYHAPTI